MPSGVPVHWETHVRCKHQTFFTCSSWSVEAACLRVFKGYKGSFSQEVRLHLQSRGATASRLMKSCKCIKEEVKLIPSHKYGRCCESSRSLFQILVCGHRV